MLRIFSDMIRIAVLPKTPLTVILAIVTFLSGYVVFKGPSALIRLNFLLYWVILLSWLLLVSGGLASHFSFSGLFPLLGPGVPTLLTQGIYKVSLFAEFLLIG